VADPSTGSHADIPDTDTDTGTVPEAPATPAGPVLRTEPEKALWSALRAAPGSTAAELADIAEIRTPAARKILATWAQDNFVGREPNLDDPRAADYWSAAADLDAATLAAGSGPGPGSGKGKRRTPRSARAAAAPAPVPVPAQPAPSATPATDAAGTAAWSGDTANPGSGAATVAKLPPGGLRGMVEDYLREHPGESFSPTAVKRGLEQIHAPRQLSSGAINNALEKLTTARVAVRTSDAPKKWALAAGA
jgi:hypothetical protein